MSETLCYQRPTRYQHNHQRFAQSHKAIHKLLLRAREGKFGQVVAFATGRWLRGARQQHALRAHNRDGEVGLGSQTKGMGDGIGLGRVVVATAFVVYLHAFALQVLANTSQRRDAIAVVGRPRIVAKLHLIGVGTNHGDAF